MEAITKRTHFNPCFWSALWNARYFSDQASDSKSSKAAREQLLNYLEINSGKELKLKADDIHFEKHLGIAEIKVEKLKELYKNASPEDYENLVKEIDSNNNVSLIIDFENHFTLFEESEAYKTLMRVAKTNQFQFGDKVLLSSFIILHRIRGHVFINSMTELAEKVDMGKFEFLIQLKNQFKDHSFLVDLTFKISNSKWTIYNSQKGSFPLSDNPIINDSERIIVTLSPFLLLIIDLDKKQQPDQITFRKELPYFKFINYKRLTISPPATARLLSRGFIKQGSE